MKKQLLCSYLRNNKVLNIILIVALLMIVINGVTYNLPVWFGLDYVKVNYFLDVLVNLAIGYTVSLVFYILVVFIPGTKKEYQLKAKYIPILGGIGANIHEFILTVFKAIEFEVRLKEDVYKKWGEFIENTNVEYIEYFRNEINEFEHQYSKYASYSTYYEKLIAISAIIEGQKKELVPFVYFFNEDETDVYTDIEEIVVFFNIRKFEDNFCVGMDDMFSRDLLYLIEIYYKIRKVQGINPLSFHNEFERIDILSI